MVCFRQTNLTFPILISEVKMLAWFIEPFFIPYLFQQGTSLVPEKIYLQTDSH